MAMVYSFILGFWRLRLRLRIKSKALVSLAIITLLLGQLVFSIIHGVSSNLVPTSLSIHLGAFFLLVIYMFHRKFIIYKNSNELFDLIFILFIMMIVVSYVLTPSQIAANEKMFSTIYLTLIPLVFLWVVFLSVRAINEELLVSMAQKFSITSIFIASVIFYLGFSQVDLDSGKYTIIGVDNSIWFGRYVGVLLLVLLLTFDRGNKFIIFLIVRYHYRIA